MKFVCDSIISLPPLSSLILLCSVSVSFRPGKGTQSVKNHIWAHVSPTPGLQFWHKIGRYRWDKHRSSKGPGWICSPAIKLGVGVWESGGGLGAGQGGCDLGRYWISCNPRGESTVNSLTHSWAWLRPAGSGGKATHTHHDWVTVGPSNLKLNMKGFTANLEGKHNQLLQSHIITRDFFFQWLAFTKSEENGGDYTKNHFTLISTCPAFWMLAYVAAMISYRAVDDCSWLRNAVG